MADATTGTSEVFQFGGEGKGEKGFSFTSDAPPSSSGYLDDAPAASSSSSASYTTPSSHPHSTGVTHTSLFSPLAQRQYAAQQQQQQGSKRKGGLTQAEYDDPTQWTSSHDSIREVGEYEEDEEGESESDMDSIALQKEWDEQVEQMKLMFQIIIFPFVGKFFGRKFAYYCKFARLLYLTHTNTHTESRSKWKTGY